ncbi:unnamed protein product, partial [Rotaria magnacalcarata]
MSKSQFIKSKFGEEDTDNESGAEAQYDLATSIGESGGIEKFLVTPCMVLYKRHLIDQ